MTAEPTSGTRPAARCSPIGDAGAAVSAARRRRSARAREVATPPPLYPSALETASKTASGNRLRSGDRRTGRSRADRIEPVTDPRP